MQAISVPKDSLLVHSLWTTSLATLLVANAPPVTIALPEPTLLHLAQLAHIQTLPATQL